MNAYGLLFGHTTHGERSRIATDVGNVIPSIEVAIERTSRDWATNYRVERVEFTLYAEASRDASAGVKFEIPTSWSTEPPPPV